MRVPNDAKKVFTGTIFDVYQWEQQLYDGTTKTFEALKRPATIQIIPVSGEKLYLSHEEQPAKSLCYTFLGGRQEKGEEPLSVAKRELIEEAGFESNDWELFKMYEVGGKIEWFIYLYIARDIKKVAEPHLDGGEKIDVMEVNFDEFLEKVDSPDFRGNMISDDIFRIKHNSQELMEFKEKLFDKK